MAAAGHKRKQQDLEEFMDKKLKLEQKKKRIDDQLKKLELKEKEKKISHQMKKGKQKEENKEEEEGERGGAAGGGGRRQREEEELDLQTARQNQEELSLDPETAHPKLILSDGDKQVRCGSYKKTNLPDSPKRFDKYPAVLAKQSFSRRRFYFEVQVKGKTDWDLGVARESINRKGKITLRPQDGYWTISLKNEKTFIVAADSPVRLPLKHRPEKVGVFVDYNQGLVSFYDADTEALIFSITGCDFTKKKLYPFFSPGPYDKDRNSAPLVITAVTD